MEGSVQGNALKVCFPLSECYRQCSSAPRPPPLRSVGARGRCSPAPSPVSPRSVVPADDEDTLFLPRVLLLASGLEVCRGAALREGAGGEPAQQRLCPGGGVRDTRGHRDTRGGRAGRFGSGSKEVPHAKGDTAKSPLVTTVLLAGRCRVEQEQPTGRAG